jgi:hypothetical protein
MFQVTQPSRGESVNPQVRVFWPPGSARIAKVLSESDEGLVIFWPIWVTPPVNQVVHVGIAGKLSPAIVDGVDYWEHEAPRVTLLWTKYGQ